MSYQIALELLLIHEPKRLLRARYWHAGIGVGCWHEIDPNWQQWTAKQQIAAYEHPLATHGLGCDFAAMNWADAFVMVQPCGRSAALELGWAIGKGKTTFVLMTEGQEPELTIRLAHYLCLSLDEIVERLKW